MLTLVQQILTTPNLVVFTITLVIVYGVKKWLSHPSELPPMPCLPIPWLGHTLFMRASYGKVLMRWKERMGDIYTFYHGNKSPSIVISSYDLIYEALVKKAALFSDRPKDTRRHSFQNRAIGLIGNSGPSWKEQRAISTAILKEFGMGKNSLAEKISEVVEAYMEALSELKEQPTNVVMLTNTAVSNVICYILLGKCFDLKDPFLIRFLQINVDLIRATSSSMLLGTLPFLRYLPGDYFGIKKYDRINHELNEMFSGHFIEKFKHELDDTSVENYIKAYLREMNKRLHSGENTYLDEINLRRHIDDLFLAGSETSSSTLLWAYAFVMKFPEIQEKVYREIEEVVGTERLPNLHDKPKLNYLNAFIFETQRLGSVAAFGVNHLCIGTTQLGGYTIPEGSTIVINLLAVLIDRKVWEDPEVFRPERFLDEHNNVVIPKEFIPFSLGKRACLGEPLAKMELFLFLSAVLQNFEILPEKLGSPPSMEPILMGTRTLKPFSVIFRKRSSTK